ncbi:MULTISPECIES: hypothetical protein [unclassified Streptomyces]|uniref:hypothetical protein n=1 Tax=unclassified Streptomyces TaxID=2593676 RepID=UPI00214AE556|nr:MULTISPECIES: hypothetical protein [unclassified Streptomyces]MCX5009851.1 hypothetical protein [Streptomyces sp. NBC_00555]MCX5610281.1 hypothetical protein [Streptomyces sp. NBC_00047]UUU38253.1 hypothetical protein JIW86_04925 [Streptomyces sp. NBC_00162]
MSTSTLLAVLIPVAVVLILAALAAWMFRRRRRLQERFGPEYDRTVEGTGSKHAADAELRDREVRHDNLDIRELPAEERHRYSDAWTTVQQRFVDRPEGAVAQADELVTRLMRDRGYPTEGYEQQLRELSVEHGRTLEHYRAAHEVNMRSSGGQATTEELRGAMVHYRALFDELVGTTR